MRRIAVIVIVLAATATAASAGGDAPGTKREVRDARAPQIERWAKRDGVVTREEARRIGQAVEPADSKLRREMLAGQKR